MAPTAPIVRARATGPGAGSAAPGRRGRTAACAASAPDSASWRRFPPPSRERFVAEVGVGGQSRLQRGIHALGLVCRQVRVGDLAAIRRAQVGQLVADVIEHHVGGIAAALLAHRIAVAVDVHLDRVGVAEKVVDVAEDLLVRAHQEEAQAVRLAVPHFVQRQRAVEALGLDVGIDHAVGVAGHVGDHAAARRRFVQAFDRRDREHLVDRPNVRHRLEHAEVDEVLVDQAVVEFVEQVAVALLVVAQARTHGMRDRVEQVVDAGAMGEVDLAQRYSDWPSLWWCCASWNSSIAGRWSISPWISRRWRITAGSSSCWSGTRPSGACSTSLTFATSTAWCAVIARPHSVMMRGGGSAYSSQASASGWTMLEAYWFTP